MNKTIRVIDQNYTENIKNYTIGVVQINLKKLF